MIEILCSHGAIVDCTKKRAQTPLMTAINTAHLKAVEVLLCHGADLSRCNAEGTSCWDMAWHNREVQVLFESLGVAQGKGVTGTGRLAILTL
jgi:ankyrin repeat protein